MYAALITLALLVTLFGFVWFRETSTRSKAKDNVVPLQPNKALKYGFDADGAGIDAITDPREMAAILMMEVARARGGSLTAAQSDRIEEEMTRVFSFTSAQAEDLAAHAAFVTQSGTQPEAIVGTLALRIIKAGQLTHEEMVELDDMLIAVSEAEGTPTRDQLSLLQIYRDHIGLKI